MIGAERYGNRIPVWTKFFSPVQTGNGAQSSSCTMFTGSVLKLTIFVGYHDIPVFIINGNPLSQYLSVNTNNPADFNAKSFAKHYFALITLLSF